MSEVEEIETEENNVKEAPRIAPNNLIGYKLQKHARREYAVREFTATELTTEDGEYVSDDQKVVCEATLKILDVLDTLSGYENATEYVLDIAGRLNAFVPLSEVYDGEDQWIDIKGDPNIVQQHIRLHSLHKLKNGDIVFAHAISWVTEDGSEYAGVAITKNGDVISSAQKIRGFPFTPKVTRVPVETSLDDIEDGSESDIPVIVDDSLLSGVIKNYNVG